MALADTLNAIEAKVKDVQAKAAVLEKAEASYNAANTALSQAKAELAKLQNEVHEALGGVLNSTRVRESK